MLTEMAVRPKVEAYWRQRVRCARVLYLQASQHHTRMVEELGRGPITAGDGAFAIASARRAEALARNQYARLMRIYGMTLQGEIVVPDEDEELLA